MGRFFSAYGTPLREVYLLRYLGQTLLSLENNWPVVEQNLRGARGKWGRLENILGREGADRRTVGRFYVALLQAVLLFRYKTWVLTPPVGESPQGFPLPDSAAGGGHGTQTSTGWDMGVYTDWGGAGNGGTGVDQGIYHSLP